MTATVNNAVADLQRANAELQKRLDEYRVERDEALERETATAEVLQVINSSPGDLAPVFDAMLARATRLCEAHTAHLLRYESGALSRLASFGVPEEFDRILPLNAPMPEHLVRDSVPARMIAGRSIIHVPDLRDDESYRVGAPAEVAAVQAGIRTALYVPLLKDQNIVGAFVMHRLEVQPYTDKQIALLQNFAAQAVIAMENARLITETREALEQQTATAEVLQVINSSPGDLAPVFDAMLEKATRLCDAAFGILITVDGDELRAAAMRNVPERLGESLKTLTRLDQVPVVAGVIQRRRVLHIHDFASSDAYRDCIPISVAAVETGGVRSVLYVPLVKDDRVFGVFVIFRQEVRPFSDKQIALLLNFAAQAVIAMENARLITETHEALEQQTATAEVLQVINSSPGDLAPVFDVMLQKAIRLCEATHGHFFNYDGESFHLGAVGDDAPYVEFMRQVGAVRPRGNAPLGRISRGERVVHTADMREEEVYRTSPAFREQVELRGVRRAAVISRLNLPPICGRRIIPTMMRRSAGHATKFRIHLFRWCCGALGGATAR